MRPLSFKRHRFPAEVIRHAVWLYYRFTLSFRDIEELLAQRSIEVSYETIRCWTLKFGPVIAANLRRHRGGGFCSPGELSCQFPRPQLAVRARIPKRGIQPADALLRGVPVEALHGPAPRQHLLAVP